VEVKRGDIVLIVAPSELGRPRPGVIVQADEFKNLTTVFVCPISSDVQENLPLRPTIDAKPSNGLRLRSQIMTDKMVALRHDRVRRVIGRLDSETTQQLDRALLVVLGLAR
jgi:mRNA interferase MazF